MNDELWYAIVGGILFALAVLGLAIVVSYLT